MREELEFKKTSKISACTTPPWTQFIPPQKRPELLRIIRQEMIDAYGFAFDECEKRLICFKKQCLGRRLPWKSKTARPFLEELIKNQETRLNPETNELEMVVQTNCATCPIYKSCRSPCNQVLDFIEKDKKPEPFINYKTNVPDLKVEAQVIEPANFLANEKDIPWDILSDKKAEIIKKYVFEYRDYRYIAETLDLNNQARVKYEFYAALNKLSEFAVMRKFIQTHKHELTTRQLTILEQVYYGNKTFVETANTLKISKQSVQQTVARIVKKYKIKWKTYVKKQGKKILYQVPELFK